MTLEWGSEFLLEQVEGGGLEEKETTLCMHLEMCVNSMTEMEGAQWEHRNSAELLSRCVRQMGRKV